MDKITCTHCKVTPTRYHLEQGSCTDTIQAGHFVEYYDDFYSKLESCFFDTYLDEFTCDECTDGAETSCTKCNSAENYLMIKNNPSGTEMKGRCVEHCPFFHYEYSEGGYDFCGTDCPDGEGKDKEFGECFNCDAEIDYCEECE